MLPKYIHEIRDPIHVFIKLDTDERRVVDSAPFQRLRHIHQLAMSYLVYPGATHKRFEHALGTMELATRVFDVVTHPNAVHQRIRRLMPEISQDTPQLTYWRRVLRMAALCHDIGHLPFSHAAEKELLPEDWNHEKITVKMIQSDSMRQIWNAMTPPLRAEDVAKIAVGPKIMREERFSGWETILSEIIVGDAFGADRIDYLLRDSHHIGVGYGRFDHHRLIDTIRILPNLELEGSDGFALGIENGGLHSAESLLLARYFMYTQVYFHPVRRIYDIHLIDFLRKWLAGGTFPTAPDKLQKYTDIEVMKAIFEADSDSSKKEHIAAKRILRRKHFKLVYSGNPTDVPKNLEPGNAIYTQLCEKYGEENVIRDAYQQRGNVVDFPVIGNDARIVSAKALSKVLETIPEVTVDNVYVDPDNSRGAKEWVEAQRDELLGKSMEGGNT